MLLVVLSHQFLETESCFVFVSFFFTLKGQLLSLLDFRNISLTEVTFVCLDPNLQDVRKYLRSWDVRNKVWVKYVTFTKTVKLQLMLQGNCSYNVAHHHQHGYEWM